METEKTLDLIEQVLDTTLGYISRNEGFTLVGANHTLAAAGLPSIEKAIAALPDNETRAALKRFRRLLLEG